MMQGSKCMLGTYFILMLIIFIVAIVGAVWGYKGDIETEIRDPLLKAIEKYKVQDSRGTQWRYTLLLVLLLALHIVTSLTFGVTHCY